MAYDPKTIEPKWQKHWQEKGLFATDDTSSKPKMYVLDMFPYPSGSGLHVGHPKGYIATDVYARYHHMKGFRVLHPMGWDAFGLPAENYALENKVHPRAAVEANIERFKKQLELIGFDYDWSREINTTDPAYYKWTQWIFLQLYKAGLAYESNEPVNWCPKDKTVLSNEDVENGCCERCGTPVEQRRMRQWVLKITDYADKLLEGLENLDWPESIKTSQRNWIGRSEGAKITFTTKEGSAQEALEVFTTRPDTIFGATYVVVAPEHPIVEKLLDSLDNKAEVQTYIEQAKHKTNLDRQEGEKDKTGVVLSGVSAINPANQEKIPIWVADYVLPGYGTGAIMAVPAHDERDWDFAKKFDLPIRPVISGGTDTEVYVGEGALLNSGQFDGVPSSDAKKQVTDWLEKEGHGQEAISYKLQDWIFSRQRYWGEPIPIIHCEKCGVVPVPEEDLPVELPQVEHYEPTGTGESPLAAIEEWVNVQCPNCDGPAKRETNTMPQWAGSSWYYLRYIDPKNPDVFVDPIKGKTWMPVDMYVGGAEHATRHLIYARFWHRFLHDQGHVSTPEPFARLQHVGLIMGPDGRKMSKRFGNVINPDDIVAEYGADTLRVYEMFMGPFNQGAAWSTDSIRGARRFLERVWQLVNKSTQGEDKQNDPEIELALHRTIQRVTEGTEQFKFNTAIAALMELLNILEKKSTSQHALETFVLLLAPYAPHLAEELWQQLGKSESVIYESWPVFDEKLLASADVIIPVQVNGKVRAELHLPADADQETATQEAKNLPNVAKYLENKTITKVIYVPNRLLNFVIT